MGNMNSLSWLGLGFVVMALLVLSWLFWFRRGSFGFAQARLVLDLPWALLVLPWVFVLPWLFSLAVAHGLSCLGFVVGLLLVCRGSSLPLLFWFCLGFFGFAVALLVSPWQLFDFAVSLGFVMALLVLSWLFCFLPWLF